MNPAISVIIPVYNGEKWITNTLKNLSKQSFRDFEVIIINDGSTDKTKSLVEVFCKEDQRFEFFNKPNGGVSSARNMGIAKASGKYIIHHDADDKMPKDALASLYECAETNQVDIVGGDFVIQWKGQDYRKVQDFSSNTEEFIQGLLDNHYHGSLCNKLIKSEVCEGITFEKKINIQEDLLYLIRVLLRKPKVRYLPEIVYYYKRREDSISQSKSSNVL